MFCLRSQCFFLSFPSFSFPLDDLRVLYDSIYLYYWLSIFAVVFSVGFGGCVKIRERQQTIACSPNPPPHLFFLISKVLLEYSHTHSFIYVSSCFYTARAELSSCDRNHMTCKNENIFYLDRKNFANSCSRAYNIYLDLS